MFKKYLVIGVLIIITLGILFYVGFCNFKKDISLKGDTSQEIKEKNLGKNDIFSPANMEGWSAGWFTQPEYDGQDMPLNSLIEAKNIDFGIKTSIAPRDGTEVLGTESATSSPVNSLHVSTNISGRELFVRTSGTTMEWWNSVQSEWETLDTGYTTDKTFTFTDGMTSSETENYTYFSNGAEGLRRYRVAFGTITDPTASTTGITLDSITGFDSADDIGFNTSGGTVTIAGNDYTYTGINGWNIYGNFGSLSLPANEGVVHAVETTGFTGAPTTTSAIVIKDQRLYAAYQNSVYCSKIDNFRDFSYSSPRVASEGEVVIFPEGGDKINGLALRQGYVAVFKDNYVGSLAFKDFGTSLSDIPVVETIASDLQIGAVSQKAITQKNFSVIYATNDIGLSELTRLESRDYDQSVSLAERIRPSVKDYDFSDSAVIMFDNYILNSVNDNATFNNKIIVYNYTYNRFTEFEGINAQSFAVYNGNLYYGDALTQNVYKMFSGEYDDNDLGYTTKWKTKWINFDQPANWKELGYIFVEGFINKNTTLTLKVNMDEGGNLTTSSYTISGSGDYVASLPSKGFGINPFGLNNFSDISGTNDNLRHFAGYIITDDLFGHKFRNIQFEGTTSGVGQNYRISKIIPYVNILDVSWAMDYSQMIIND